MPNWNQWLRNYENTIFWNRLIRIGLKLPFLKRVLQNAYQSKHQKPCLWVLRSVLLVLIQVLGTTLYFLSIIFLPIQSQSWFDMKDAVHLPERSLTLYLCLTLTSFFMSHILSKIDITQTALLFHNFHLPLSDLLQHRVIHERQKRFALHLIALLVGAYTGSLPIYAPFFALLRPVLLFYADRLAIHEQIHRPRLPILSQKIPILITALLLVTGSCSALFAVPELMLQILIFGIGGFLCLSLPFIPRLRSKLSDETAFAAFRMETLPASQCRNTLSLTEIETKQDIDQLKLQPSQLSQAIQKKRGIAAIEAILMMRTNAKRQKRKRVIQLLFLGIALILLVLIYSFRDRLGGVETFVQNQARWMSISFYLGYLISQNDFPYFQKVDRYFLPYAYYRSQQVVKDLLRVRTIDILRQSVFPICTCSLFVLVSTSIIAPDGRLLPQALLSIFAFVVSVLFFPLYNLGGYMAFQPFDQERRIHSVPFKIMTWIKNLINLGVYYLFFYKSVEIETCIIFLVLMLIFIVIGLFAVPKLAPKNFRLRKP